MPRQESAYTPAPRPAPFRHPYFATARDEQAAAFREEVRESIARDEALRARLARARVLESVQ